MRFTKMHGLGNDYVYVNGFEQTVADPVAVAKKISDRHFGVGSDGLILILPSDKADVRMRMFNIDGSEGEMCGNGIRCVAKYSFDHGLTKNNPMRVETGRGVLTLALQTVGGKVQRVTVNMGEPILDPVGAGFDPARAKATKSPHVFELNLDGQSIECVPTSVGNPHVAFFVEDVDKIPLERVGPMAENHPAFPKRVVHRGRR